MSEHTGENDVHLTDDEIGLLRTSRGLDHVPTEGLDAVIAELAPTVEHIIAARLAPPADT